MRRAPVLADVWRRRTARIDWSDIRAPLRFINTGSSMPAPLDFLSVIWASNASLKASHTIGISRSRLPLPRTEIESLCVSMWPIFVETASLTRMPVAKSNSTMAMSRVFRRIAFGFIAICCRVELSRDLTAERAIVRGRLNPTLTSFRNPAIGFDVILSYRSKLANIDFTTANRRRTVRGFALVILPSQRRTMSRFIAGS